MIVKAQLIRIINLNDNLLNITQFSKYNTLQWTLHLLEKSFDAILENSGLMGIYKLISRKIKKIYKTVHYWDNVHEIA